MAAEVLPRRSNLHLLAVALAAIALAVPVESRAQAKDAFVEGLLLFSQAASGNFGDEGPSLQQALAAMEAGLEGWNGAVARVEAGFAGAIKAAAPREASQMRATLAVAYLDRGRLADALTQLDTAASSVEAPFPVHVLRGLAADRANQAAVSAEAFRRARALDPAGPVAAYLYLRATRETPAAPDRAQATAVLIGAVAALASGSTPARFSVLSVDVIDDAAAESPLLPPASYADAFALVGQGRHAEALTSLRAAVATDPLTADRALDSPGARAASALLRKEDARGAIQALSSVPAREASSEIQRLLGLSYWAIEDYAKSLEHLAAAARLNPADERARLSQADVLVASGDGPAARSVLTAAVAAFPKSGQARWRLGRLLLDLGDEAGALRAYEAVAGLMPVAGASAVHAVIGRLQHRRLELDLAASAYERRVRLAPNLRDAHLDLGDVYRAQGRTEDALVEYAVAAALDPTSAPAFAAAGQVRAEMADDEGAVPMLQAAVRLDAAHLEARYALSRALLRLGRAEEARRELDAFERLQKAAMDAERRRFDENARAIERTLRDGAQVPVR